VGLFSESLALNTNTWIRATGTSLTISLNEWVSTWLAVIHPSLGVTVILSHLLVWMVMMVVLQSEGSGILADETKEKTKSKTEFHFNID
tara:strand:+ start:583 stop:849 length:267 start_codon:yes stop_codon:yes gene_type:complete